MITLINPLGIKTFPGLQMHTLNPPMWFLDRFFPRRRWRKLAETAHR
jgi:hypothetical protein